MSLTKSKIIAVIITLGLILIAIFKFGFGGNPISIIDTDQPKQETQDPNKPALISSDPPELLEKKPLIFKPDQVIKLTFNVPLQNGPETKIRLDPPHEFEVTLTNESKTAVITPKSPYKLGQGYTLFIKADTKLQENGKLLEQDYNMHFNVINYSGI